MKRFPSILSALLCALFVLTCSYPTALAYATETTGTTQAALLHNDSWFIPDSVTGLSLSEVNVLYNNFLATHTSKINEQNQPVDTISSFVQYAVDQHIISNTQEARKSLSVASMRVFLSGTATAAYIPLPMASTFLQHSLADYPSNLSYGSESSFAKKILVSPEMANIISSLKSQAAKQSSASGGFGGNSSVSLSYSVDLRLALRKVSYSYDVSRVGSTKNWKITIVITDTYNFDESAWVEYDPSLSETFNNWGIGWQKEGVIVPYDITITLNQTISTY